MLLPKLISFTAVGLVAAATLLVAQARGPGDAQWQGGRGARRNGPLVQLTRSLDLTPEQRAQVLPIVAQAGPQIRAIRQEARQKVVAVREATMAQVRPILTPEQQQKLDALRQARAKMQEARRELRLAVNRRG